MKRRLVGLPDLMTAAGHPLLPEGDDGTGGGTNGGAGAGAGGDGSQSGRPPQFDGRFDAERAARLVENLRGEVADLKAKNQAAETAQAETMAKFAAALGLTPDAKPDPEKLAADLTASRAEARAARTDLALVRAATKLGADVDALLDSRSFAEAMGKLDPSDQTFAANVEKAVSAALEQNPRYKATAGAPQVTPPAGSSDRSGGEFNGSPGQVRQVTEAELARMTPDDIVKAQAEGRLAALLGTI